MIELNNYDQEINKLFDEIAGEFTVFIVEQRFAINNGFEYFKKFHNTPNFISSDFEANSFIQTIINWIGKKIPNVAELIQSSFINEEIDIPNIIDNLFKLFTTHQHEAAGPEVTDPIIIQESKVNKENINQIISLHKNSILKPRIIIILADNNFERASTLLSFSPTGTRIKFIRNDFSTVSSLVLNEGVKDIDSFINIYSKQCFNACSRTKSTVLYNKEWANNSIIKEFGPSLLHVRTKLLYGEKLDAINIVDSIIKNMANKKELSEKESRLLLSFEGIAKLFRVFCYDNGGNDIKDSLKISNQLKNEIFSAHVYRYAFFMDSKNLKEKDVMLLHAKEIFNKNNIVDHSIYCENNLLTGYFYNRSNSIAKFDNMLTKALNDVPGLVGMPIIYNNTGVAYMFNSEYQKAIDMFILGLSYQPQVDHKIGLMTNLLIAKYLYGQEITENEINAILIFAITNLSDQKNVFLSAPDILNILIISQQINGMNEYILENKQILLILEMAIKNISIGQSSLLYQLNVISNNYTKINLPFNLNKKTLLMEGRRKKFMDSTGFNPAIFYSWL